MGWRSDWLYQLIFGEIEALWLRATKEGVGRLGPPPQYFHIRQLAAVKWESPGPKLPVKRAWIFDAHGLRPVSQEDQVLPSRSKITGMFYEVGDVGFYVEPARKRIVLAYILGPRYARGEF